MTRAEAGKARRAGVPIPRPAAIPRQARAMSAGPDGTIVIEVADDIVPGARLTLRPDTFVNVASNVDDAGSWLKSTDTSGAVL